ncbi:MAG: Ig-like domain-containing protein, partial [Janthinobacterium lividum]
MPSNETLSINQTLVGGSSVSSVPFIVGGLSADNATGVATFSDGTNTVSVPVSADGTYSADLSTLQNGTVTSELTYSGSASGTVAGTSITLDTVPPTITIGTVATGNRVDAAELASGFAINGTTDAENSQTVTVTLLDASNSVLFTDTASVLNGVWSAAVTASQAAALANGQYTITAGVSDLAGNAATAAQQAVIVDTTPPTVTSVTAAPGSGDFDAGQIILITLQMSEAVTVNASGGVPSLALNDGGSASLVSGSGTNALVFSYTVAPGDNVASLAVTGASLNGGVIADLAGNAASLAAAASTLAGTIEIDTTAPSVAITGPLASDDVLNASEAAAGLTVSGTTSGVEDGQTLTVSILDGNGASVVAATVMVVNNAWSLGFTAAQMQALADSSYTVQATVA